MSSLAVLTANYANAGQGLAESEGSVNVACVRVFGLFFALLWHIGSFVIWEVEQGIADVGASCHITDLFNLI